MSPPKIKNDWIEIPNPYSAGIPIEKDDIFVGRESLMQEVMMAFQDKPVWITGHRRMGMTSVLKYIQRRHLQSDHFVSVFLSAEKFVFTSNNNFLFSFCRTIAHELEDLQIISEAKAENHLSSIIEVGMLGFKIFFEDILSQVGKQNKTLVLLIDHHLIIHKAIVAGKIDSQFAMVLNGYLQNNGKTFKMIYSGASDLQSRKNMVTNDFLNVGKILDVGFLNEMEVKELITKPLNNRIQFTDDAFKYLMDLTNGHAFFVQVILSYLVDKLNREKSNSFVYKDAIEKGVFYFLEQAPHLQDDWNCSIWFSSVDWPEQEKRLAKMYKQLIITTITDHWRHDKNGASKVDLISVLENSLKDIHNLNYALLNETLDILAGPADILKCVHNLYFIKIGLFREWIINKMNFTLIGTLNESKKIFINQSLRS